MDVCAEDRRVRLCGPPQLKTATTEKEMADAEKALTVLRKTEWLCEHYDKVCACVCVCVFV
jgi:hypothetical protein